MSEWKMGVEILTSLQKCDTNPLVTMVCRSRCHNAPAKREAIETKDRPMPAAKPTSHKALAKREADERISNLKSQISNLKWKMVLRLFIRSWEAQA